MIPPGVSLLLLFLCPAFSLPVPTQLSKEDETVVKCISEILADALSRSSPMPVTSECMKTLREDERVVALLHHRHLLKDLEELAHQENAKHLLAHEIISNSREEKQGELQKRDGLPQQEEAAPEKVEEQAGRKKEEEEEEEVMKKEEKTKNPKENIKVSPEEDLQDSLEERDAEEQEEKGAKEKTASETWHSKEYFGHVKKRGSRHPQTREGVLWGDEGRERGEAGKRRLRMAEEEMNHRPEEEEQKNYHQQGGRSREEEEERSSVAKRVAEKASDEETAQFEEEEKGLQSPKAHLHKSWRPWKEEAEEQEEQEQEHGKAQEVEKLDEVERRLKWAADRLEELKRG